MNAITNVVGQSLEDGARVARLKKAVDEGGVPDAVEAFLVLVGGQQLRERKNNIKLLSQALRREVKYECNY